MKQVRNLEKTIASVCRKAAVALESGSKSLKVTDENIEDILGKRKYTPEK